MGSLLSLLATSVMESDTGSYIVAAAALPLGCYFVLQHALTLWHRPSTSLSGWNTVALGHGLAATICLLLASLRSPWPVALPAARFASLERRL